MSSASELLAEYVYTYLHAVEEFPGIFTARQNSWGLSYPAVIRPICFENVSCRQVRLHAAPQLCVFSTSRRCDGRISPSTSHFPSVPGNCCHLGPEEVQRVIDSAENLMRRAM